MGNDIVCLDGHVDVRERFAQRVLSRMEHDLWRQAAEPSRTLAAHWAAKEAVYKLLRQEDATTAFLPSRYEFDPEAGTVTFAARVVPVSVTHEVAYVFAECHANARNVWRQILRIPVESNPHEESRLTHDLARAEVARAVGIASSEVRLVRAASGALEPWQRETPLAFALSLTHEGGWAAVSVASWPKAK